MQNRTHLKCIEIEDILMKQDDSDLKMITKSELCEILNISSTTLWRWEQELDDFPKMIRFSKKGCRFLLRDVRYFIENKTS